VDPPVNSRSQDSAPEASARDFVRRPAAPQVTSVDESTSGAREEEGGTLFYWPYRFVWPQRVWSFSRFSRK